MKRVIVMGAGGRDFHDFATVFRDDPDVRVVAFTAAQIPGIDDRRFPASLAGPTYPDGIPIRPQAELTQLIRAHQVDEVVLAYSDLAYADVMHLSAEVMAAGADFRLDYEAILRAAEAEADVIVWDGGNNDLSFYRPDLMIAVVDPLRPGHECGWYPGEVNLRLADVVVVNKIDSAQQSDVDTVLANVRRLSPNTVIVRAESPVVLSAGLPLARARVLVVEDGPTITHGGMPFGAGTVAARQAGAAELVDPRPYAVGSIAATFENFPHIGPVLPAMGYGDEQLADLTATIAAVPGDVVVTGTPIDLARIVRIDRPVRHASYSLREIGNPDLAAVLAPFIASWRAR